MFVHAQKHANTRQSISLFVHAHKHTQEGNQECLSMLINTQTLPTALVHVLSYILKNTETHSDLPMCLSMLETTQTRAKAVD